MQVPEFLNHYSKDWANQRYFMIWILGAFKASILDRCVISYL